jgi:hypothetical protein
MNYLLAMLNTFIDPAETVRRTEGRPQAWLPAILVGGLLMAFTQVMMAPFTIEAMRNDPPPGIDPAKVGEVVQYIETTTRFTAFLSPVMLALMVGLGAALIAGTCMVVSVNFRFGDIFNLVSYVSLINVLASVAHLLVLRGKGEVNSMKELLPSFGLEMFLPEGTNKLLYAVVGYFSVFNIWHIVMLTLGLAALLRVSKGKAFALGSPSWIAGLLFALVAGLFR